LKQLNVTLSHDPHTKSGFRKTETPLINWCDLKASHRRTWSFYTREICSRWWEVDSCCW